MAVLHLSDISDGSVFRGLIPTRIKKLIFISASCGLYTYITGKPINNEELNKALDLADSDSALKAPMRLAKLMLPTMHGYARFDPKEIAETAPTWLQYATAKSMEDDILLAIEKAGKLT